MCDIAEDAHKSACKSTNNLRQVHQSFSHDPTLFLHHCTSNLPPGIQAKELRPAGHPKTGASLTASSSVSLRKRRARERDFAIRRPRGRLQRLHLTTPRACATSARNEQNQNSTTGPRDRRRTPGGGRGRGDSDAGGLSCCSCARGRTGHFLGLPGGRFGSSYRQPRLQALSPVQRSPTVHSSAIVPGSSANHTVHLHINPNARAPTDTHTLQQRASTQYICRMQGRFDQVSSRAPQSAAAGRASLGASAARWRRA